jgi:hypothetical protein
MPLFLQCFCRFWNGGYTTAGVDHVRGKDLLRNSYVRIETRDGQNVGLKIKSMVLVDVPMLLIKRSFTDFPLACTKDKRTVRKNEYMRIDITKNIKFLQYFLRV